MSILVIGESCTDIFTYCLADRLCPDIPVPVLKIENIMTNPGMAGNVYRNIEKHFKSGQVHLITNANNSSITKNRFVHSATNHMFCRVDTPDRVERVRGLNDMDYSKFDIVVISDYNKGYLHEEDIKFICSLHSRVFVDTKKKLGDWIRDAFLIKINNTEFTNSIEYIEQNENVKNKIVRTVGGSGCIYQNKHYNINNPVEVKDSSGAGDSFLAALVIDYHKNNNIESAIIHANKCASQVVKHRGVTVI
jgi:D-beta-D-heptose 7-phosphate kinase/D-beta-D-heptose 1-phosphate adenosyltransferase